MALVLLAREVGSEDFLDNQCEEIIGQWVSVFCPAVVSA
jgi:hypothetical protein